MVTNIFNQLLSYQHIVNHYKTSYANGTPMCFLLYGKEFN